MAGRDLAPVQTNRLLKLAEKRARQAERQRKGMNHG